VTIDYQVLGRASELAAFIKHGYQQGYVEIELKGKIGTKNLVVRRNITGKGNTSTWVLGGKSKPKSDVDKAVAELGVQVGNLCSFLPQDRVNEFAKLKPEELLVETQKVAGHEKLTTWHEQLIEMGKGLKEIKEVHFVFSMLRLRQPIAYRLI
jgi:chromosome segregation ATPase